MTRRELDGYLQDILEGARVIREHIGGCSYEQYSASVLMQDAVERRFAIIGEALSRAVKLDG